MTNIIFKIFVLALILQLSAFSAVAQSGNAGSGYQNPYYKNKDHWNSGKSGKNGKLTEQWLKPYSTSGNRRYLSDPSRRQNSKNHQKKQPSQSTKKNHLKTKPKDFNYYLKYNSKNSYLRPSNKKNTFIKFPKKSKPKQKPIQKVRPVTKNPFLKETKPLTLPIQNFDYSRPSGLYPVGDLEPPISLDSSKLVQQSKAVK